MRTTIDLPDDLLRRTKAVAALRGMKMKDLIEELVRNGLGDQKSKPAPTAGMNQPIPVVIPETGTKIPIFTNAEIFEILDREDHEAHGRLS